MSVINHRLYL